MCNFSDATAGLEATGGSPPEATGPPPADHYGLWLCVAVGRQRSQQGQQSIPLSFWPLWPLASCGILGRRRRGVRQASEWSSLVRCTWGDTTRWLREAQTSDMMICWSEGAKPNSAWELTGEASAKALTGQAECGISPQGSTNHHVRGLNHDRWFCVHFSRRIKLQTKNWVTFDT